MKDKGIGTVEVLANIDEITSLADKGYPITFIHRKLYSEKKLTISYKQFWALSKRMNVEIRKVDKRRIRDIVSKTKKKKSPVLGGIEFDNNPDKQDRHF